MTFPSQPPAHSKLDNDLPFTLKQGVSLAADRPMLTDGPADGLKKKKPRKSLNLRGFVTT